jgi:DNA mismatch repair protein MutL
MAKIKVLPENLANQIAAGEVVERPASVIKELIENSIDAGATKLQVDVELGGRRLIRVSDDGEGMVRDDAVLAFERHATSKISALDDLGRIFTLGFRGEALASIASVAKVELITRVESEIAATRVVVEGGRLVDVKDAARGRGTTISVRELFFNTPARRKFMRSEATENYHLTSIVTHYALAHPEIAFTLTINGRESIRVSPAKDLRERAFQIFGAGLLESLLPVTGGREFIAKVTGFVSAPRERRTSRDSQYFFINKRFVRDKAIAGGLLEGYRSVLPHGVYPVAFLFLDVPVEEIDVNVHPAKTEVRFRRTEAVKDVIAEAVREALRSGGISVDATERAGTTADVYRGRFGPEPMDVPTDPQPVVAEMPQAEEVFSPQPKLAAVATGHDAPLFDDASNEASLLHQAEVDAFERAAAGRDVVNRLDPQPRWRQADGRSDLASSLADSESAPARPPFKSADRWVKHLEPGEISGSTVRPIDQLQESFIIAVDDQGLLLIDQHVAHERILFDKYRRKETERPVESQNLLLPETMDLTPAQAEAFELVEEELAAVGFGVMRLSGRTVAVRSIPTDLPPAESRNVIKEILETVASEKRGSAKAVYLDDIAASLACKAAIKINMRLTPEKMQWLIDRLFRTSSPTTCPHGRPVILRLSMKDIERGFDRT